MQRIDPGKATLRRDHPVVAGAYTTIHYTYTAGHPIDDSGYVKIAFRIISDFGEPQFDNPAAPNFCSVSTTGDCRIEPRWDPKGHTRPWSRALFLKVRGGFLDQGEKISVVFGDTSNGSPGWQMQTFCVESLEFKTLADPIATYQFNEIFSSPNVRIVPGKPVQAVCIAPSQVMVDESFTYHLKLEDRWGNPTDKPQKRNYPGWETGGWQTIFEEDEKTGLSARSNPIEVLTQARPTQSYWGDFHGQTEETVGSNSIEDYFTFGRDYGLLDIAAHQGNDFQITDEFWEKINKVTKEFYKPGVFVTFPGYEWSGNTPLGGDRNVYFTSEGGQITRSSTDLLPGNTAANENSPTAEHLFENLTLQNSPHPFVFAHAGGRYADIRMHDPSVELAVEVHSAWGTFEWLVEEALQRGYRIGICANSDGHKCRPGASYPGAGDFGSLGGLTCVLASGLDRESVFEALIRRHFYATTGNRSLLEVKLLAGDDGSTDQLPAIMGDVIEVGTGTPYLGVWVVGSAPVESVEVRNGDKVVSTMRPYDEEDLGRRVKISWSGAEVRGRDRMVRWDGGLRVRGNTILDAVPINFWNPDQPLERIGGDQLTWKSVTTGGVSGVILTLEKAKSGTLVIDTLQQTAECEIDSLALEPEVRRCGGLQKEIKVSRLPDKQGISEFSFNLPLTALHKGDNPIYIRMTQEDGHMAWSSPVYVVRRSS